jgi:hypothetical protein
MACSSSSSTSTTTSSADTSEQVCQTFRDVAGGAFGESMSNDQIASALDEVGSFAQTATGDIAKYGQQVAAEANVKSLRNGSPNKSAGRARGSLQRGIPALVPGGRTGLSIGHGARLFGAKTDSTWRNRMATLRPWPTALKLPDVHGVRIFVRPSAERCDPLPGGLARPRLALDKPRYSRTEIPSCHATLRVRGRGGRTPALRCPTWSACSGIDGIRSRAQV